MNTYPYHNCNRHFYYYLVLALLAAGLFSCKTAEQVSRTDQDDRTAEALDSVLSYNALGFALSSYRNTLSDVYLTQQHDMPQNLLRTYKGDQPVERDPFDGFRVQLLWTRNVAFADSIARRFRLWADTTIAGYRAKTYILFQQPYYKVHVGDFHAREKANTFSRLVKRKYPDAWVVHDRINPTLTPADTVSIQLKK